MSASLVGSEMCIRDRRMISFLLPEFTVKMRGFTDSDAARAIAHRMGPVSYTHLTLPTICSV
eukprot:11913524-Alexandrium_andersonii.AAC.1